MSPEHQVTMTDEFYKAHAHKLNKRFDVEVTISVTLPVDSDEESAFVAVDGLLCDRLGDLPAGVDWTMLQECVTDVTNGSDARDLTTPYVKEGV